MNHSRISQVMALCGGALLVAGCSSASDAEPAPTETVTETVTATPDAASPSTASPSQSSEVSLTERGNVPMPDASTYEARRSADDSLVASVTSSDVSSDVTCASPRVDEPDGQLLRIDLEITVEASTEDVLPDGFWLSSDMFQVLDEDGEIVDSDPGSTSAAYGCMPEGDRFPYGAVRGGTTGSGPIILETSVDQGHVVMDAHSVGEHFEWDFDLSS